MKKLAYLFAGMAAFGLCSCSSDEPSNPEGNIAKGDVAYLNVNIIATGTGSRATSGDFEYGDVNEQNVKTAYFYFYDNEGNFVTESNTWAKEGTITGDPIKNVEVLGKNTVVLEGLTGKEYPNWVVTVLNKPEGMTAKRTIKEMGEQLTKWCTTDESAKFVMSTTSYNGTENTPYYFATKLTEDNFSTQPSEGFANDQQDAVKIYVERLAARVEVTISSTPVQINGVTSYKVPVTIAGKPNADSGSDNVNGSDIAAENVYIQVAKWDLISTAKESSLSKQLDGLTDWTTSWNDATNFRSYWGKSTTYGLEDITSKLIEGKSYNNLSVDLNGVTYCNETTNKIEYIINDANIANPSKTPTVLLKAKIVDINGDALDLVSFLGINFTKEGFLCKVLDYTNEDVYNGISYKDGENYKPFDETCLDVVKATYSGASFGAVEVNIKSGVKLYSASGELDASKISNLNASFRNITSSRNEAIGYNTGMTYYAIPLEHINTPASGSSDPVEGQYGVVRNHIYKLNITKITSIGDGVFDPEEKIEPDPKTPNYYVESQINILSWKVVSQEAEI